MVCAEHSLSRSSQKWDGGRAEKQRTWGAVGANEGTRQRLLISPGWWRIRVVPAVWLRRGLLSRTACHPGYDPLVGSKVTRLPNCGREPARRTQVAPSFSAQTQTYRRRSVNGITSKQGVRRGISRAATGSLSRLVQKREQPGGRPSPSRGVDHKKLAGGQPWDGRVYICHGSAWGAKKVRGQAAAAAYGSGAADARLAGSAPAASFAGPISTAGPWANQQSRAGARHSPPAPFGA